MDDCVISDLIGAPFEMGAKGPDKFDCYSLVAHLLKLSEGAELPDYDRPEDRRRLIGVFHGALPQWAECEPSFGAVVLFRVPGSMHVGLMLNRGQFIHTWEKSGGVCIESLKDWSQRVVGFYRYVG